MKVPDAAEGDRGLLILSSRLLLPASFSIAPLPPSGPAEVPDEPVNPRSVEEALPAACEGGGVDIAGADGAQREVRGDDPCNVAQAAARPRGVFSEKE